MDNSQISSLALQIRFSGPNKNNTFAISCRILSKLLTALEVNDEPTTSSFHVKTANLELSRDIQFLTHFITNANSLKVYSDGEDDSITIDLSKFSNLAQLELNKVDVNIIKGLQTLRPQLQKISCQKSGSLEDILINCGGDASPNYCWSELKEAAFVNCKILQINGSLECVPWLHTLDLSHNEIKEIDAISSLPNLKCLNLSYNKLEVIPQLKGQICSRLQNLVLKNNFIEDISALRVLSNLCVLDLSNNCLVNHKCLLALAYSATLQYLNLTSNPLFFHPNHRHHTAGYLHTNTAANNFVLNNTALTKNEKKLVGSYYPHQTNPNASDSLNTPSEKIRKVRHVVIEEAEAVREIVTPKLSASPQQYLETKKQIEDLHEKFGESWLNSQSGILDVLGLEDSVKLSSSPYQADFTLYSGDYIPQLVKNEEKTEEIDAAPIEKAEEELNEDYLEKEENIEIPDDPDVEGEETLYIVTISTQTEPIFVVIGQTHISEKEIDSGNERVRWHLDSIATYERINENQVQIDFDTMRKDRKQRIYIFDDEIEQFMTCLKNKMDRRERRKSTSTKYQCMRCSSKFSTSANNQTVLGENVIKCPSCDSTLVVEDV